MRVPRFYLKEAQLVPNAILPLSKEQAHYALTVLRLKDNRQVEVFDGMGTQAQAILKHTSRRTADIHIQSTSQPVTESPVQTILLQAVSKGDHMDYTLQKSVELGVTAIQPLLTEHCDVKLDAQKLDKKQSQWQAIAINACEQSGRNTVPKILPTKNYQAWLDLTEKNDFLGFVLDPYAQTHIKSFCETHPDLSERPVHILVGPEGGLTKEEVDLATQLGFQAIQLGPRILRTETAGAALLAILQTLWGDF